MIKGLSVEQDNIVKNILKDFKDYNFFYYGSRVKGNFVKSSDLDILIKGEQPVPSGILEKINNLFYISSLPFIVNLTDFNSLDNDFYNKIAEDLVQV